MLPFLRSASRGTVKASRRLSSRGLNGADSGPTARAVHDSLSTLSTVLRFGAGAYVFQEYIMNSTMCVGPSMMPTVNPRGDVLLAEYVSPRLSLIRSGDVVVATKPNNTKVLVVKRVRGMAGERIWVKRRGWSTPRPITVPPGHLWLEGDNPSHSTDSREYGPVPMALIRGRILCRFWPPTQACVFRSQVIDHTAYERTQLAGK